MTQLYLFSLLTFFLFGCVHKPSAQKIQIRINQYVDQIAIDIDEAQILQNRSVWVRKFELSAEDSKSSFLAQRRALFIQIFQDENDPYTHRKIEKSRCLRKVESDRVFFLSGSDKNWSGCTQQSAEVAESVRQWFFCGSQAYELTAKNILSTDQLSVVCTLQ